MLTRAGHPCLVMPACNLSPPALSLSLIIIILIRHHVDHVDHHHVDHVDHHHVDHVDHHDDDEGDDNLDREQQQTIMS